MTEIQNIGIRRLYIQIPMIQSILYKYVYVTIMLENDVDSSGLYIKLLNEFC
jgi:hypothetical protein